MYSKRKMCCLIATCSLLVCMFRAEIFAKGNEQQELPEIIRWEEGRGFDEQGEQIVGSWAYDTVNVEGKYVLFDDMGNVRAKTDQWKERETYAENFTDTEQATATLALRTEYFPKFTGTVYITIQKENGESRQYELSPDNLYEQNVAVNNGVYKVKAVEAVDEQYIYKTEYAKDVLEMEQNQLLAYGNKPQRERKNLCRDNCNDTSCYICGVRGTGGKPDFFFISVSEIPVGTENTYSSRR